MSALAKTTLPLVLVIATTVLALAGCKSRPPVVEPVAGAIHGRIEGVEKIVQGARVQVYRMDDFGTPTPGGPFEWVDVDALGRFTTRPLTPGRYRLVYRNNLGPPSATAARVPGKDPVTLRPVVSEGLVDLRVAPIPGPLDAETIRCRITEAEPLSDLPDLRELRLAPVAAVLVRGLRPGRWYLDLPELGATTEIVLPKTDSLRELDIDPPPLDAGATLAGTVRRLDGGPAAWVIVSARPLTPSLDAGSAWGRFAITDRAGRFEVVGIPPGPTLIRVECREVRYRILPAPEVMTIPPSGRVSLSFIVEP